MDTISELHDCLVRQVNFDDDEFTITCKHDSGSVFKVTFRGVTSLYGWDIWEGNIVLSLDYWQGHSAPMKYLSRMIKGTQSHESPETFRNRKLGDSGYFSYISSSYGGDWMICSKQKPILSQLAM